MKDKNIYKVLIIGGDGMAGSMISAYLRENDHIVYTTTRRESKNDVYFFDAVSNIDNLKIIINEVKPSFVINCIGMLNQSAENNKSAAVLINSYLPHYIDNLSQEFNFKFIHISTDCIFSGEKGAYEENDLPDANSFYGRTKSLGEVNNDESLTFRTSIIGPDLNENGIGLFNWFMKQSDEIGGFTKVAWSGVTTLQLAKAIEKSFQMNISGLYHLVNNESIDKYSLLLLFAKYMNKDISIVKNDEYICDKSLVNTRIDFKFDIPTYDTMVEEMSVWIKENKNVYRHYCK